MNPSWGVIYPLEVGQTVFATKAMLILFILHSATINSVVHLPLGRTTALIFGNAIWAPVCLLSLNGELTVWLVSSHLPLALSIWIYIVRLSSHSSIRPGALPAASSSTLSFLHPGDLLLLANTPLPSVTLQVWLTHSTAQRFLTDVLQMFRLLSITFHQDGLKDAAEVEKFHQQRGE